ncbi:MAG: T9SS type A sorting domain-containing protein [Flavobacteriaceae bacterium]|nr:T9SS type A sorting domain-containing protein [Flavobacteriaceae bacterium]
MKHFFTMIALAFCISANAQITWNMGMNISTNTNGNMHPRIALDRLGNPLVVWGKMSDESVYFSKWNGTMFTTPVKLNPSWMTIATASWQGADIASHGDTVYVVVKRTPETSNTNRIFIFTSFNGGNSFNTPVELAFIADSMSRFPTLTTDATGNPIVAYMKFNSSFMNSRWVVAKSTDYGSTFTTDVKASGWGSSAEVCDCCPGAIVSSGNKSAMLYRDNNKNMRDIWTGISNNNATSFPSGFEVDSNNWMVMSCPSSGPDGVIVGDTLYSTFMSSGSGAYRTYLSKSSISTGVVSSITSLTGTIAGLSQQNYPRIATDGNAMAIVWKQNVSGMAQLPILFTNDITNSLPTLYETVDLDNITNADIAMSNGKLYVVWQDDGSNTVKYRSGTYTPTTGINETNSIRISLYPNPVSSTLTLQSNVDLQKAEINIFNLMGKSVVTQYKISNSTRNIAELNNGIYFLQVSVNNRLFTQKFIKK